MNKQKNTDAYTIVHWGKKWDYVAFSTLNIRMANLFTQTKKPGQPSHSSLGPIN